jgi:hypothetical protein
MPKVFRFRLYDVSRDEYVVSTRLATKKKIKKIGGEIIPDTDAKVYDNQIIDGMTERHFDPTKPSGRP